MTDVAPRLSIVIPLYNKAAYIARTLASVMTQSVRPFEVVIVDDGSSDNGVAVIEALQLATVRVIRQANGGVSAARNRGIREARGSHVLFLDADDEYRPGFLAQILLLIAQFPAAGLYACNYQRVREDGTNIAWDENKNPFAPGSVQLIDNLFATWALVEVFFTSSVCVPRAIFFERDIWFPQGESLGEDQDVWFGIAALYPVAYCNRKLVSYNAGISGSLATGKRFYSEPPFIRRLSDKLERGEIAPASRSGVRKLVARQLIATGRNNLLAGKRLNALKVMLDRRVLADKGHVLRLLIACALPVNMVRRFRGAGR